MTNSINNIEKHFQQLILERGKNFFLGIGLLCTLLVIIIDPPIIDLSQKPNAYLLYSHIAILLVSIGCFLTLQFSGSKKITSIVLYTYLFVLTTIESAVSGWLDTLSNKGSSFYLISIFIIGFLFFNMKIETALFSTRY